MEQSLFSQDLIEQNLKTNIHRKNSFNFVLYHTTLTPLGQKSIVQVSNVLFGFRGSYGSEEELLSVNWKCQDNPVGRMKELFRELLGSVEHLKNQVIKNPSISQ